MTDIFDRINGTVVTPELLLEVLEMHIALSPEDGVVARFVQNRTLTGHGL
jgi:hypothetical protein